MKQRIPFPFIVELDNNKDFAYVIDLARKSGADITALTTLGKSCSHPNDEPGTQVSMDRKKDEIYCKLLKMLGFYLEHSNDWNAISDMKIYVSIENERKSEPYQSSS